MNISYKFNYSTDVKSGLTPKKITAKSDVDGKIKYLVEWNEYNSRFSTWEEMESLPTELVDNFEKGNFLIVINCFQQER